MSSYPFKLLQDIYKVKSLLPPLQGAKQAILTLVPKVVEAAVTATFKKIGEKNIHEEIGSYADSVDIKKMLETQIIPFPQHSSWNLPVTIDPPQTAVYSLSKEQYDLLQSLRTLRILPEAQSTAAAAASAVESTPTPVAPSPEGTK